MDRSSAVPDRPEVACPWCAANVALAHFASSDEETGTQVATCPGCGRRVPLALPLPNETSPIRNSC